MTDINAFIDNEVKSNDVVLFMKGTPQFPMCGFPARSFRSLIMSERRTRPITCSRTPICGRAQGLRQLADHSAALHQGRIRGRLRYRPRDVPVWRIAAGLADNGIAAKKAG